MEKTSNPPIPVTLVTGLLGSGKTTALKTLLRQKPESETWGLLINEFGQIGIDSLALQNSQLPIEVVSGGCICCSATLGYQQALKSLLQYPITRILIEPTGLGHPAKIIDMLRSFHPHLILEQTLCLITPQQLNPHYWQKSAVLRDLVNLADVLLLNKTDTANPEERHQAQTTLDQLYPAKTLQIATEQASPLDGSPLNWQIKPTKKSFNLLEGLEQHQQLTQQRPFTFNTHFTDCLAFEAYSGAISSIGWQFKPNLQFNRIALQTFLEQPPQFIRAKGILRTGNEWQLLNHLPNQTTFEDIAWRQDSRLTLILDRPLSSECLSQLEQSLTKTVRNCDA